MGGYGPGRGDSIGDLEGDAVVLGRGDPIFEGGVEGCGGKLGTIGDGVAAPCGWT